MHHAQRQTHDNLAIASDVDRVNAILRKTKPLEVHHHIPCEEGRILRQLHIELRLDRHAVGIKRLAVFVDDVDGEFVTTGVFLREAESQRQGAGRMHHRQRTGGKGVEGSGNDELAVVIGSKVAKRGNLNVHDVEGNEGDTGNRAGARALLILSSVAVKPKTFHIGIHDTYRTPSTMDRYHPNLPQNPNHWFAAG